MQKILALFMSLFLLEGSLVFANEKNSDSFFADETNVTLHLRPRYEYVDVKNSGRNAANALTLRTSLGVDFMTLFDVDGLKAYVEATDVSDFGVVKYYDSTSPLGGNDKPEYERIIDPTITRITQAYLSYTNDDFTAGFGRRVVKLDNERFVGAVGWRQMFQSFGVVDFAYNINDKGKIYTSYVYERKGIIDELSTSKSPKGENSFLINTSYSSSPELKIVPYAYLLNSIHDTYGMRVTGHDRCRSTKLDYLLEGAFQGDASLKDNGKGEGDSYYYHIGGGMNYEGFIFRGNYEVLGEAKDRAPSGFSTPWGTNHGFNGWSDVMLGKASSGDKDGMGDAYGTIGYEKKRFGKALFVFHKFDSVKNSLDFGKEYDLLYQKKIRDVTLVAKAAFYEDGDDFGSDTQKFWLMAVYNFKD